MKSLPKDVAAYKRTPTFTEHTVPAGLLKAHSTKAGTWGMITILSGQLLYRILEPELREYTLDSAHPGVVEPTNLHEVSTIGAVSFYVEFYRTDSD